MKKPTSFKNKIAIVGVPTAADRAIRHGAAWPHGQRGENLVDQDRQVPFSHVALHLVCRTAGRAARNGEADLGVQGAGHRHRLSPRRRLRWRCAHGRRGLLPRPGPVGASGVATDARCSTVTK